ncbi:MAG TPA: hypothetical protein PKI03_28920, partial [Pseudomonadota bacterium]|nr:hypothetical protein [Pseudomonadota bacterium]
MAEESRQPQNSPSESEQKAEPATAPAPAEPQVSAASAREAGDGAAADAGAPIPPDAVDPELIRLSVPTPRRHPGVAIAVLVVSLLLLYRLRTDLRYALQPAEPQALGAVTAAVGGGKLPAAIDGFVSLTGVPDHRNALAFDPKGGRPRQHVFRLLGTRSRVFVTAPAMVPPPYRDEYSGRLRRFDDLSFADVVRSTWGATQVLRALDVSKLRALPPGALAIPLQTQDRAGEPLSVTGQQDLLIDVLFPDDVRVLLSKEKVPSLVDADHEVERFGLAHGPGVETKDGYGYVLRLPPVGPDRQRILAQIDAGGVWLWHRVETYRVPTGAVQVTPAGLLLPGPDALPQPVRYRVPAAVPGDAAAQPSAPTAVATLLPQKEPATLLLWEQIEVVQISEPMTVAGDALVVVVGETPKSVFWTLPMAGLLLLCFLFNL